MSSLPSAWLTAPLNEIATTKSGGTPNRSQSGFYGGRIPWVKSGELRDGWIDSAEETITELGLKNSSAKVFPSGTLCVALYGATVGRVGILRIDAATNQAVCGIDAAPGINTKYLFYFILLSRPDLIRRSQGGAQPNINQGIIREMEVPICSSSEQSRIVSEIEKQFTRLDAATAALKRVQANLKRYRASVLKAACEGRLVPTEAEVAKREGRVYEPANKLLERILSERRARWETNTIAKMIATRKPAADDRWKARYKEPQAPTKTDLPRLPMGWCWTSLDQLSLIQGGVTKGQKRSGTEQLRMVPYLRVANVQRGLLDLAEVKEIEATFAEIAELTLIEGDLLLNEGGDRDKLGRGWIWEGQLPLCIHQNHVFRARVLKPLVQPRFVSHYANAFGQKYFFEEGKHTTNLASLSMTKLKALPIPLPPADEQIRIVQAIAGTLSRLSRQDTDVENSLIRANVLRRVILQAAFAGKLVPQHSEDEPASTLLRNIQAERSSQVVPKRVHRARQDKSNV